MKYSREFRDAKLIQKVTDEIQRVQTKEWTVMEICGGQTHAILRYGLDQLLPDSLEFIHGPGCPVCVTPLELVDKALTIAAQPGVIFCSFGDMLRVPGSGKDLFSVRATGADIRVVYSPMDAATIALENSDKQVVFFAIGFETTAPANAMSVLYASSIGLNNFSLLVSQVRVPPAVELIISSPNNRVQGLIAAGHVCTVMGYWEYLPVAEKYQIPIVVTGFEPLDLLNGILRIVQLLEKGINSVENAYPRAVSLQGNLHAQETINRVFMDCDQKWRGIGIIPASGWKLKPEYAQFDAEKRFHIDQVHTDEPGECIAGEVLMGNKKPRQCPAFGTTCTPEHPLGATMVSSEGACAAYYRYSM